jgi:hypothetical protein
MIQMGVRGERVEDFLENRIGVCANSQKFPAGILEAPTPQKLLK